MEKSEQKKTEKKKAKRITGRTVTVCLLLIFIVYIGVSVIINSGGSIKTYIATNGEESESFTVDGYIFKEQTVITAPKDGYLECIADESGRVANGGTVAYIYESEVDTKTRNRISELETKIAKIENDNLTMAASENDALRLEQDIASEIKKIPVCVRDNDMSQIEEIRESLDRIMDAKRKISGEDSDGEATLKALKEEKAELESRNAVSKTEVTTPVSGSFTARVDGLEEQLGADKLSDICQSYLNELKSTEIEARTDSKVKKGDPIGKVVDTYTWYFAAEISEDIANTLSAGDSIRLKFLDSSDNIISGSVYSITDAKGGKAVLVIESSAYVDNLYAMSGAKVEIIRKTYEGLKIPAECVRVKADSKGVYIVSGNKVRFRNADVYYIDDDWAIVSKEEKNGIKLYDEVIVSGSNIYEGKVVR